MKKITTGFEILDSAEDAHRCVCSEGDWQAVLYDGTICGCQCGCKGPSSAEDNLAANLDLSGAAET